jgi:hypothetical protein
MSRIFFGYPSSPDDRRDAVAQAAARISRIDGVETQTWEALQVSGAFIIDEILSAIDESDVAAFEITDLNQNVMFELGYSLGSRRPVWLMRDPAFPRSERVWRQMNTLTTIGYVGYTNTEEIFARFMNDRPDIQRRVIFDEQIGGALQPEDAPSLFYVHSLYETNPSRGLTRRVQAEDKAGIRIINADPQEAAVQPLLWYAQQIYASTGVVVHFDDPARDGADVHNARNGLIAGLARGMGKPVLMLAQDAYTAPLDYRDMLYAYRTTDLCVARADAWIRQTFTAVHDRLQQVDRRRARLRSATELKSLQLGEPVAENEVDTLWEYFLRTNAYEQLMASRSVLFVGRKGAGKSAHAMEAASQLSEDRRNVVCLIKPYGYELDAIRALSERYQSRDEKGYVTESLWKFLLYSEIALAAYQDISSRAYPLPQDSAEAALVERVDSAAFMTTDFAVRLERAVEDLVAIPSGEGVEAQRTAVSERLHTEMIAALRRDIVAALGDKVRIAVVIDNLDRAWDRSHQQDIAEFLLALVRASEQMENEVRHASGKTEPIALTVAVFLRSDIFDAVSEVAPEPDKLPVLRLDWRDPALLIRVIEERYAVTRDGEALPDELWEKYFSETVRGVDTRTYIVWRILPRPRDVVIFVNAAISSAINRRSPRVEEQDLEAAELTYSQFAFEVLTVENTERFGSLEDLLFGFLGAPSVLTESDVLDLLAAGGAGGADSAGALEYLRTLSFLGVEVREGGFAYLEDARDTWRIDGLAQRRADATGGTKRYCVHPAFRPYLEIEDCDLPEGQLSFAAEPA